MSEIELELAKVAGNLETVKLLGLVIVLIVGALIALVYSVIRSNSGDTDVILRLTDLIGTMQGTLTKLNDTLQQLSNGLAAQVHHTEHLKQTFEEHRKIMEKEIHHDD